MMINHKMKRGKKAVLFLPSKVLKDIKRVPSSPTQM